MLLTLVPPAIVLVALSAAGRLTWPWTIGALAAGLIIGTLAASAIAAEIGRASCRERVY